MNRLESGIDHRKNSLLLLILVPLIAASVAWWCMASGIGVSPDSVIYLSAADSVLAGEGLKAIAYHFTPTVPSGKPLVAFPPTYPLLISLSNLVNTEHLTAARCLHSFLFAVNIFLVGVIVYLATDRSALAALTAMLLSLSSARFLEIHTMAWSEAPFILFILLAVLLLLLHVRTSHYLLLIGASVSASLAITTRYAGVTVLPPMILTVVLLGVKKPGRRIRDCVVLVGIAIIPLAAWLLRNEVTADSATGRTIALHPVGVSDIGKIANALLVFELPATRNSYLKIALLLLGSGLLAAAIALSLKRALSREPREEVNFGTQLCAAAFVITYLLFLVAYNSLMDPAVDLDTRTVLPAYVIGVILIISVIYELSRFARPWFWCGFLALSLVLVSLNMVRATSFAIHRHQNGIGYTSREWINSETIAYLRSQSEGRMVYSNAIDAIHFLTGREALRVPAKFDPTTRKNNPDFERSIGEMRNELIQNRAVLLYLDNVTWRRYLPSKEELENIYKLPVLTRLNDGVVYGVR